MKRIALAVALLIGLATSSRADFQDGLAAYDRGDCTTAFREFKPLAEQGNAEAALRQHPVDTFNSVTYFR